MSEVASAYVSLLPSAQGFQSKLEGQISAPIKKAGSKMGGFLGGALRKGAIGVTAAAGAGIGTALFKGFKRLDAIDQAKAKLTGLGNSTKTVNKIMDNALASVKGTAFGLDEAATTAGSVVAAGIKPGKQLQGVLKTVADTATIAGSSMSDMGLIFGSVAARGKLQGDDLMQLQSRGIPVLATLAKHYGITAQAASVMVSKGQVDFKNFADAMHEKLGGAALSSGKTFKGAMANMLASLGRIGANLLSGVFPLAKKGLGELTGILSGIEPVAARIGNAIGKTAKRIGDAFATLRSTHSLDRFADELDYAFGNTGKLAEPLGIAFGKIADAGSKAYPVLRNIAGIAWDRIQKGAASLKSLATLDFSRLGAGGSGKAIGKILSQGILDSLSALGSIGDALLKAVAKVDWVGVGIKAGTYVIPFAVGLAAGVINGILDPALWNGLKEHWFEVLIAVASIAFAPAKVAGKLAEILTKIPFAGKFLAWIVRALNGAGGKVKTAVAGFFSGFFRAAWQRFSSAIRFPGAGIIGKVLSSLKNLPPRLGGFFSKISNNMFGYGIEAGDRFVGALGRIGARAVHALGGLAGRIKGALAGASKWLYTAGQKIISGLIDGIKSKVGAVTGAVGGLLGKVRKYLPFSPAKIGPFSGRGWTLYSGRALIDGLIAGIQQRGGAAASAMSTLMRGVAGSSKGGEKTSLHDSLLKDFLAGSRNGEGKLTKAARKTGEQLAAQIAKGLQSGKNSLIGKALGKLGDNIGKLPKSMRSAVKGMTKAAQGMLSKIGDLKSQLADIASSVTDAFRPSDLFSGNIGQLSSGLSTGLAGIKSAAAALPALIKKGLSGDFLNQLFASGNTGLILQLAGSSAATDKTFQDQWDQIQKLSGDLGKSVAAADPMSKDLAKQTDRLVAELRLLRKELETTPKKTSAGLNKASSDGKRKGKK